MFLHCVSFEDFRTFSFGFVDKCNTWQRFRQVLAKNTTAGQHVTVLTKIVGKPSVSVSKIFRNFSKTPDIFRKCSIRFENIGTFFENVAKSLTFLERFTFLHVFFCILSHLPALVHTISTRISICRDRIH